MEDYEIIIKTLENEKKLLQKQLRKQEEIDNSYKKNEEKIKALEAENKEIRNQLESILYSRSYKFSQKIVKLLKR